MSAKRTVIEQKFKKMEAEAKRLGVTLLTKPEAFIDDDHQGRRLPASAGL